jgi:alpha-glucosidase
VISWKETIVSEPWWKTAVFYQIYPRSFKDSNDDGVGDIPGIISKLDYLVELGVNAIWVSPFFKSPMDDFGYDISDYRDVDPIFGSLNDARRLIRETHRRRIKIIFDLVINHTSDQHPWFIEARSSRENPKHDWYIWKPRTNPSTREKNRRPNNWVCQFELKSAWWDNEKTDEWYLGTFTRHQPEVNWRNPELREAMYGVIRFWLDEGVDGFRMDVVNWYVKDDQFRSNPFSFKANPDIFQKHIYDRNREETHEICREIRKIVDSYPGDRVLIGEIFTQDAKAAAAYQGNGSDELNLAFNMELLYLKWNAASFVQALARWYSALPERGWPNITLSNHDQPRHASRFHCKKEKTRTARMQTAAMLLLTVRGTPFLYYGEEIGMANTRIPRNELVDPTGKTFWPLPLGRDGERTPMQWTAEANAGFTAKGVQPWLRIDANHVSVNVESNQHDPESIWHWYRLLLQIRKETPTLQSGDMEFLPVGKGPVVAYRRNLSEQATEFRQDEDIECYLNFSEKRQTVAIAKNACVLLGNRRKEREILPAGKILLAPNEALLVRLPV